MSRILVAEDDPDLRAMYERWLSDHGQDLTTAGDGGAAVEALGEGVELLITDRDLPGRSGDELVANADCPAVVVVSAAPPDDSLSTDDVDEYLLKPVSRDDITGVADRHLR
jgi:CheY-like chemotaxis protein